MRPVLALALAVVSPAALACGYCVEDRVAAVYDHAVVVRALERRHPVVFLAIEGPLAGTDAERKTIEGTLRKVSGVDPGSLRVSLASAALSFAYDPGGKGLGGIMSGLDRTLGPKGLSLSLLRVIGENDRPR